MGENSPTVEELKDELAHRKLAEQERKTSNELYAVKLVERIVFGMVTLILLAVVGALISLVVRSAK